MCPNTDAQKRNALKASVAKASSKKTQPGKKKVQNNAAARGQQNNKKNAALIVPNAKGKLKKKQATTTANAIGSGAGKAKQISLKTAEAIAKDSTHPKSKEIKELLSAHKKGWVDAGKFQQLLQRLVI